MNRIGKSVGAVAAVGAAVGIYAFGVERLWLQVTRPVIHVRGLPRQLEGLRIALLTDMHGGGANPLTLVRWAVRLAMREQPHLIALTGDFAADHVETFRPVLQALCGLKAPLGVFAVPGNHDHTIGIARWHRDIAEHPTIQDLTNTAVVCTHRGVRICIAGVDDFYVGRPDLKLPDPGERDLTILLAHGPDQAERLRRTADAVDLVLSGHTHGGQVKVPGVGAPYNSAEHEELYLEGLRRRPWTQVYTSRGIGTVHLPFRFFSRPEVAVLRLTGRQRPRR